MSQKYTVVSLFSGAGGMDLGLYMEGGFEFLTANDVLLPPAHTYAENFGHKIVSAGEFNGEIGGQHPVYIVGDVSSVDFSRISGSADVVVGGPPCQDFSIVRGPEKERMGIKVKRGKLYAHFVRALMYLQPKVFVFENVPGLLSANNGTAFETIIEDFSHLNLRWSEIKEIVGNSIQKTAENYEILFAEVVDSSELGVPQKRKRLIIVGAREDVLPRDHIQKAWLRSDVKNILSGSDSLFKKYPLTPLEVFEGKPLSELQNEYREVMEEYRDVAATVRTEKAEKWVRSVWENLTFNAVEDYLFVNGAARPDYRELEAAFEAHGELLEELGYMGAKIEGMNFPDRTNEVSREKEDVLQRLRMIPPDENHEFVRGTQWEVEGRGMSLIYRRIHPLKPSYTVVAYGGGGTWGYHYRRNRGKLTNRERARLQTFPDTFLFKGTSSEVRAQIGEAVPPLLGKKIARAVKLILEADQSSG
ncbi:hypothetical protein O163_13310 [Caldanaerobacter subterraneus subsp. yonseiensis KB-1]|uniref:Cytosine-specific methyltransferase n=1 Tax=Caldanaerobacter subterraneus subsp. yonseiensis KB-1 TaxID=1388761 RepID=U5CLP2_CALSX|nr:DNA cytosine methyltransferase [Caldanaerobacter subterraneus]ERM90908.1 hypothetical protein O163_13310 [Caldanaerobacter subterraneus subsp. yonseiensis KB-1]